MLPRLLACLAALPLLVACGDQVVPEPTPLASLGPTTTVHPEYDAKRPPASAVLSMVPTAAHVLTVTDFDEARVQLGVPDLTSEDPMADRTEFWERAEQEVALLTDGMLREVNSVLMLDYGFTQDDVDWEAHFAGPGRNGFVLALRPDLGLDAVERAIQDGVGPLAGATLLRQEHLVVSGTAAEDEQVWANEPIWRHLTGETATATYAHRGCIPVLEALGPDADNDLLDQVQAAHPVPVLDDLAAFTITYGDRLATVRLGENRDDLFSRLDVGADWPRAEFPHEYREPVGDPTTGRIGYVVPRPARAVALALLEELPFGICNEITPLADPTGL